MPCKCSSQYVRPMGKIRVRDADEPARDGKKRKSTQVVQRRPVVFMSGLTNSDAMHHMLRTRGRI